MPTVLLVSLPHGMFLGIPTPERLPATSRLVPVGGLGTKDPNDATPATPAFDAEGASMR